MACILAKDDAVGRNRLLDCDRGMPTGGVGNGLDPPVAGSITDDVWEESRCLSMSGCSAEAGVGTGGASRPVLRYSYPRLLLREKLDPPRLPFEEPL